jgi:hypothetical protein
MIKKKAKGQKIAKKTAKKKGSPKKENERNPAAVRNDIVKIVESSAREIAEAVVSQAKSGQLAPAKYLFEIASDLSGAHGRKLFNRARREPG